MAPTRGTDLVPTSREGKTFRWSDKRMKAVVLDAQGMPDNEIAEIVGFSIRTVQDNRLWPQYREKLAELRSASIEETVSIFQQAQREGARAMLLALAECTKMLNSTVYNADGEPVPNFTARSMAVKLITDMNKVLFGKWFGVGNDDGSGEAAAAGSVIRATVRLELPSGDGSPTVSGYEVIDGNFTEVDGG